MKIDEDGRAMRAYLALWWEDVLRDEHREVALDGEFIDEGRWGKEGGAEPTSRKLDVAPREDPR